ncbi:alpha/beta fold hydrolase [Halogeometricum limi]|uniref:Pimeloyl-ACP methyl ester carboxylesterase n=1 Tax=Halogeometricum limi TaxID=555875 RepID=A0A1I6IPE3_9EURY|nr:alpha/beta fold hydrolase [Halogeometricum limi]SFR68625.1 Pimeloyl-ACP methyl ester carboxylesterase [Halogeometricum limi]
MTSPALAERYGLFEDRIPYYRAGDGPETLVVLPGLSDAFSGRPSRATAELLARTTYRGLTDEFTVWTVSRPRNLDGGTTTREMAGAVATFLDELDGAHVLGYSMGGFVAQHLAADYPEFVDRLVLGSTAAHVGDAGRAVLGDWQTWAENGDWGRVQASASRESFTGWRRWAYPPLLRAVGPLLRPPYPDDVLTSLRACLDHDTTDRLAQIRTPTLVVGGDADRLFPPELLRETKERLPDATLALLSGAGHAAAAEQTKTMNRVVRRFLREEPLRG